MPTGCDLVGKRFDRLVVLRLSDSSGNRGGRRWVCQCDCGNEFVAQTGELNAHRRRSCGCALPINHRDLTGLRFGSLVVQHKLKATRGSLWRCRCDCGKLTNPSGSRLMRGDVRSCGCSALRRRDFTGRTFGRLTVLRLDIDGASQDTRFWLCECSCGSTTNVKESRFLDRPPQSCPRPVCRNGSVVLHGAKISRAELASIAGITGGALRARLLAGRTPEEAISNVKDPIGDVGRAIIDLLNERGPMCCTDIVSMKSNLNRKTLYPLLNRLETNGVLRSRHELRGRATIRVYSIAGSDGTEHAPPPHFYLMAA
jgi:hypothetical protein